MKEKAYFIGVDVGSTSVRAGLFDASGDKLAQNDLPIDIYKPKTNFVEQSSKDIWNKTCQVVRKSLIDSGIKPAKIKGIAFDATCSLVVLDSQDDPVSISPTGDDSHNIIMWMDHRAIDQADRINKTESYVLKYVGGTISPEMEIPKVLWLKENMPDQYDKIAKFLDLADFLAYKATGVDKRSVCTLTCKWTYLAHEKRFDKAFFTAIGLENLLKGQQLGEGIEDIGTPIGFLTGKTAEAFGLKEKTMVAVGAIDAHAGGLGSIGAEPEKTIAIIGGTSSCHMAVSKKPLFVPGVWGPYYSSMLPGLWLSEGGQSTAGALLDHVLRDSAFYSELVEQANASGDPDSFFDIMGDEVLRLEKKEGEITRNFHLLGYYYGNRSPRADPTLRGMISGLSMDKGKSGLARRYLAAIQSVAYGTRHIIESMNKVGYQITEIHMCGGGIKNPIWLREHADITGCNIILPVESQAVILGSAMIAAAGTGYYKSIQDAMKNMYSPGKVIEPDHNRKAYHDAKYKVFQEMYKDQMKYRELMEKSESHLVKNYIAD
jgi:FGGY-family pentulose kinase